VPGSCPELVHTIGLRAYRPLAPRNLQVKGDGHAPTYSTGEAIVASWTVTDVRRPLWPVTQALSPDILMTVLEVRTLAGELKGTFQFGGTTSPQTITKAQLTAVLGTEFSFELRTYFQRDGHRSLDYDSITVAKV